MKKIFTNPTMDIELFDVENIVTASNGTSVGTGTTEDLQQSLSGRTIYKASLSDVGIVF